MKRFILFVFLLLVTGAGMGQNILIKGRVSDKKTGQPVVAANIVLPGGTGTYSGVDGKFEIRVTEFPVTLQISHISYGKTDVNLALDPKGLVVIELDELVSEIGEVQVSSKKLRILTEKEDFTLQDFAFDKDHLWLIGYMNNQATQGRLWLSDWFGDTICSIPVRNPERLYTDVFENVHLVLRDTVRQLFSDGKEIVFAYSFDHNAFFQTMAPIRAGFAGNLVYQKYLSEKQGLHT